MASVRNLLDEIIIRSESTFLSHYKEEDDGKWKKKQEENK